MFQNLKYSSVSNISQHFTILIILFIHIILIFSSCGKPLEKENLIKTDIIIIKGSNVIAQSKIIDISDENFSIFGHCWGLNPDPTIFNDSKVSIRKNEERDFQDTLTDLLPNTTYFIRAFVSSNGDIRYGKILLLKTKYYHPDVVISGIDYLSNSTVKVICDINNGSYYNSCSGFSWSDDLSLPIDDWNIIYVPIKDNSIKQIINDLIAGQKYYIKSFVCLNSDSIFYSDPSVFQIPKLIVNTTGFKKTGTSSATLKGEIKFIGFYPVTKYGFCWSQSTSSPNLNNNLSNLGYTYEPESFSKEIFNITPQIPVYFRAYAIENGEVVYGEIIGFML